MVLVVMPALRMADERVHGGDGDGLLQNTASSFTDERDARRGPNGGVVEG